MTRLAPIMQGFFTDHLITQRHASPHTVASYRDTLTLLLGYAHQRSGKLPAQLDLGDLDAALVGSFLTHLEEERGNSAATRNARLTAIRALFRYASLRAPEHAALIARVLAIPAKRTDTTIVCFLAQDELDALIAAAAAAGTWHGRRDHALLALTAQTGLRVSELTGLRISDTHLGSGPHVYCRGKGRRDRCTPLTPPTVRTLTAWLRERRGQPGDPVFPTQAGNPMSRDAVSRLLAKYAGLASASCPSLKDKTISPHTLRHSAAMALVAAGVDPTVIALWMGHASPLSTRPYLHADMKLKQQAADRLTPPGTPPGRYHAPDELLAFLCGPLTARPPDSYAASATRNPCSRQGCQTRRGITTASAYWHTPRTLARWCRIRSYLDSAANHGLIALDAITRALRRPLATPTSPLNRDPKPQLTTHP